MTTFIPDKPPLMEQAVPFFEESQQMDIPGRGTKKTVLQLQGEVSEALVRLNASLSKFASGEYSEGERKRYGFRITFVYGGLPGRIDCAALPLKKETPAKKERALAQALYLLRDELVAMAWSAIHKPGSVPLLPYIVGNDGNTVTEALVQRQQIPEIAPTLLLNSGR